MQKRVHVKNLIRSRLALQVFRVVLWPFMNRKGVVKRIEKEQLDVDGMCEEWDSAEDIRQRLRDGLSFIHPEATKDTVQGCCLNSSLLAPLLTRMSLAEGKLLPGVDSLRLEIDKLLTKNKRAPGNAPEEIAEVVKASWRVKKLLGLVKMKARREEVSTVTCLYILYIYIYIHALSNVHKSSQTNLEYNMSFNFRIKNVFSAGQSFLFSSHRELSCWLHFRLKPSSNFA